LDNNFKITPVECSFKNMAEKYRDDKMIDALKFYSKSDSIKQKNSMESMKTSPFVYISILYYFSTLLQKQYNFA
jgi:hypothetical protein